MGLDPFIHLDTQDDNFYARVVFSENYKNQFENYLFKWLG